MNDIQQKLLEIAKEYIKVCEKLNLRYFALGGTALGAMRHNGFIPWDDDLDFGMPRKDYETFIQEAPKYLAKQYFVQCHKTEKKWLMPYMKLRDSNTTAIENGNKNLNINKGLWIDIFPLDGLPDSMKTRKRLHFWDVKFLRRRYIPQRYKSHLLYIKVLNFLIKLLLPSKRLAFKWSEKLSLKYDYDKSIKFWCNWDDRVSENLLVKWFDEYELVDFENIKMRVPKYWDEYLTDHYGNWRELPPIEKQVSNHNLLMIDLDNSYLKYVKKGKYINEKN